MLFFVIGDVPPSNIFNYNKTWPRRSWVFVRHGRKQVENVQDHSKTSISVMWCGSASGECLPLMVVYKAENLYKSWVKGGLKGCIYNVTKSGWFDSACFQQWFVEIFMKTVAEKPGKYVLLGDNLASHFNLEVIKIAKQNDVSLLCFHQMLHIYCNH